MIATETTLAELAVKQPAASRVFYRHGLDFCCHGNRALSIACEERGLTAATVLAEIETENADCADGVRWEERPLPELIAHIVNHYHRRLREELPNLVAMTAKVVQAHRQKPSCPRGLLGHLEYIHIAVLDHLAKEENILFPMIAAGRGQVAHRPIHIMEVEHTDHAENLKRIRVLSNNLVAPPEACPTWRALYLRLEEFERELMQHIHLENNVLFRRALCE